jgi:hypothetical protein
MPKVDAAVAAYQSAVNAAGTKAKSDCAANVDSKTIKNAYNDAVKAAHKKFQSDTKGALKLNPTIKALRDARRTAVKNAQATFKSAAQAARTTLKAAFPSQ